MKDRTETLQELLEMLKGFRAETSKLCRGSFDVIARHNGEMFCVKVLGNIDGLTKSQAEDLRKLSKIFSGASLVLGKRHSHGELLDYVIYRRFMVPSMTPKTLEHTLEVEKHVDPAVFYDKGGYYVQINGGRLRERIEERGQSLGSAARETGVSPNTLHHYLESGRTPIERAVRLEEVFGDVFLALDELSLSIPEFTGRDAVQSPLSAFFSNMGFRVEEYAHTPFSMTGSDRKSRLLIQFSRSRTVGPDESRLRSIAEVSHSTSVVVGWERKGTSVQHLTVSELDEIHTKREFFRKIQASSS